VTSDLPTADSLNVREMRAGDLESVLAIETVSFSYPWRESDFLYSLEKPGGECLVAESAERLIGYSVGFRVGREYHLADFAITPGFQRRGLGAAFLELLVGRALEQSIGYMSLEVRISNVAAIALYQRGGFRQVAIRGDYYSQPKEDGLVMLKVLEGDLADWLPGTSGALTQAE